MAIKAVLFDFGGVFTDSPFHAVEQWAEKIGGHPETVREWVFGRYDEDGDHPWHKLERGETSLEATREEILAHSKSQGLAVDIYELFMAMAENHGGRSLRQPLAEKCEHLKQAGYRLALLTNNVREFSQAWREMLPVDELFDFVIDSSEVGVRKPNPNVFDFVMDQWQDLAKDQIIFLDDYPANVEAARAYGLHALLVTEDMPAVISALEKELETHA